jgi:hypothetical protein
MAEDTLAQAPSRSAIAGREKLQSPYPDLQTLLLQLPRLNPGRRHLPVFRARDEAEHYLNHFDGHSFTVVVPVWKIDHVDLRQSKIIHWSVAIAFD